jgi:hypothetical protein
MVPATTKPGADPVLASLLRPPGALRGSIYKRLCLRRNPRNRRANGARPILCDAMSPRTLNDRAQARRINYDKGLYLTQEISPEHFMVKHCRQVTKQDAINGENKQKLRMNLGLPNTSYIFCTPLTTKEQKYPSMNGGRVWGKFECNFLRLSF